MSIVHASIIPELDEVLIAQKDVQDAIQEIEGELYFMRPETIVVMQTSGPSDAITVSVAECIEDAGGRCVMRNDLPLVMHIKAAMNDADHSNWLYLDSNKTIDASIEESLVALCAHVPRMKYVHIQLPLASAEFPLSTIRTAGTLIGSVLLGANERIALVAMGKAPLSDASEYTQLQNAIVQKDFSSFETPPGDTAAVSAFATTLHAFISTFHGTQFDSRLLYNKTISDSYVMIADLAMS